MMPFCDHTEHMVFRCFMCVPERFVPGPTPAVRPTGGMLSFTAGPCVSPSTRLRTGSASWSALLRLASVRSNEARRGVNGFGAFCSTQKFRSSRRIIVIVAPFGTRQATSSPAGAKPGNTGHHVDRKVGSTSAMGSPASAFLLANPK